MVGLALAAVMVCSPVFSVKADTEDEIEAAEQKADELESQKEAAESEKPSSRNGWIRSLRK